MIHYHHILAVSRNTIDVRKFGVNILTHRIAAFSLLALLCTGCQTRKNNEAPAPFDGMCALQEGKPAEKCVDYARSPGAAKDAYAEGCQKQGGSWKVDGLCQVKSGTKGCELVETGGGAAITTWYVGSSFTPTTEIACGNSQRNVTKK